jgi:DMSO/TMAO reductase YedYZ heme-binding membrane subunit
LALPVLATANTPAQRKLGKYWKRLQRMTYVIWFFAVVHLLLLDGIKPFGAADGDGIPVFHQRFYQAMAVSIPLIVLRLPPVRRWVTEQRAQGRQWMVWLTFAPLAVFYITSMAFIINNEIFQGMQAITLQPIED